jgi:glycosyltransferase involved in cell wall biosynthesis
MSAVPRSFPVTLLVITHNEAHNIARCLDSVSFVAEKVVVDSGSTDDTVRIAEACGARVVQQPWLGFGPQRNFATTQASHDWILVLDADEAMTPALAAEFEARLPGILESRHPGAELRRAMSYMGAPMRWYRPMVGERVARFYHRARARWTDARVHEALRFDGRPLLFKAPFVHHHNPTIVHRYAKVLRYSELKAQDWLERGRKPRIWACPFVYLAAFFKDYVLKLAFLDGARGYAVAHVAASYAVYKRLRLYEMTVYPASRDLAADFMARHGLGR